MQDTSGESVSLWVVLHLERVFFYKYVFSLPSCVCVCMCVCVGVCVCVVLGIECRALSMLGKHSTTELHPQS
jgi:hypothetical protein